MKIKQLLYDWRRCLSLAGAAAAVLFSTSCKDDPTEDVRPRSSAVSFEPSVGSDDWNTMPQTRSGGEGFPVDTTYVIAVPDATPEGEPLYLHVAVADGIESAGAERLAADAPQTRGAQITGENFHDSFGVCAVAYEVFNGSLPFNLMNNLKVEKSANWATDVRWPSSGGAVFYAYAPHSTGTAKNFMISNVRKNTNGEGVILDVSQNNTITPAQSTDLLVCGSGPLDAGGGKSVAMNFRHVMAAIKIKADTKNFESGSLGALAFQNIQLDGTLTFWASSRQWSNLRHRANVYLHAGSQHPVGPGADCIPGGQTFFAIPQTLSNPGAAEDSQPQLRVIFNAANEVSQTANIPITGSWEAGKTYTYTLSRSSDTPNPDWDYTFEVNNGSNEVNLDYHQQSIDIPVKSFGKPKTGTVGQQAVGWDYEYSIDNGKTWKSNTSGNISDILSTFSASKSAPIEGSNGTNHKLAASAKYADQTYINVEDQTLKSATHKGSSSMPYDLSIESEYGVDNQDNHPNRTTSNCYIVSAPGWYKIPAVYGNAIKNGMNNTAAYKMTGQYDNCQGTWVNHGNQAIQHPWITDQLPGEPAKATYVWQDVQNLVTNISLDTQTKKYITFYVAPSTIAQGNAVICLLNHKNEIMWSWHIWVTPYKSASNVDWSDIFSDRQITNQRGMKYTVMGMPVGHCTGVSKNWDEKFVLLRFTQNNTKQQKILTLKRRQFRKREVGNTPLYQFGRPVPLPAGLPNNQTKWADYNTSLGINGIQGFANQSIDTYLGIQRPTKIYYSGIDDSGTSSSWTFNRRRNYWDMADRSDTDNNGAAQHVIKTIYDPSPRGYAMPTRDTFSGFLETGTESKTGMFTNWSTPLKSYQNYLDEYGIHFRVQKASHDYQTIFLPSTGYRNSGYSGDVTQSIYSVSTMGCYWTATYMVSGRDPHRAHALIFSVSQNQTSLYTQRLDSPSDCLAVIGVKEQ